MMARRSAMRRHGVSRWSLLLGSLLAACSTGPERVPVAVSPVVPAAPTAPALTMPPPANAAFASAEVVWALRGGLNVAALLCNDRSLSGNYNQILKVHRRLFNDAHAAEQARFRQMHGSGWQARHDTAMTRLYNGFASVPDRRRFCRTAVQVAGDAVAMPSAELARLARQALFALEPGAQRLISRAY